MMFGLCKFKSSYGLCILVLSTDIVTKKSKAFEHVLNRVVQKYNKYIRQTDTQYSNIRQMCHFKESFLKVFSIEMDKKFQK